MSRASSNPLWIHVKKSIKQQVTTLQPSGHTQISARPSVWCHNGIIAIYTNNYSVLANRQIGSALWIPRECKQAVFIRPDGGGVTLTHCSAPAEAIHDDRRQDARARDKF
ncbi:unnamed protein product [Leuciscus chuanchicus]